MVGSRIICNIRNRAAARLGCNFLNEALALARFVVANTEKLLAYSLGRGEVVRAWAVTGEEVTGLDFVSISLLLQVFCGPSPIQRRDWKEERTYSSHGDSGKGRGDKNSELHFGYMNWSFGKAY
jgi:hypothetical protein